ncbi:uncharacterized protein [Dermacentor albipictus]|uniref:uncharacterized protein isoform X7 n=1 Tax=Dermacentor albipictus TaxID=60249 RepID=UPI0038FCD8F6
MNRGEEEVSHGPLSCMLASCLTLRTGVSRRSFRLYWSSFSGTMVDGIGQTVTYMDVSSLAPKPPLVPRSTPPTPAQPAQPEVPLPPGYERQAAPPAYYGAEAYGAPAPAQPAQPEVPLPPGYERQAAPPAYYGVEAYGAPDRERWLRKVTPVCDQMAILGYQKIRIRGIRTRSV